jgi:hypothetical protein
MTYNKKGLIKWGKSTSGNKKYKKVCSISINRNKAEEKNKNQQASLKLHYK